MMKLPEGLVVKPPLLLTNKGRAGEPYVIVPLSLMMRPSSMGFVVLATIDRLPPRATFMAGPLVMVPPVHEPAPLICRPFEPPREPAVRANTPVCGVDVVLRTS